MLAAAKVGASSAAKTMVARVVNLLLITLVAFVIKLCFEHVVGAEMSGPQKQHSASVSCCVVNADDIDVGLRDVGGLADAKAELLYSILIPMRNPRIFYGGRKGLQAPRGFLLAGEPGTGKTMLARALAKESGACFLAPTLSIVEDKYYGESAKLLQSIWSVARARAPSIIFIDEIDGWISTRRSDDGSAATGFKTELLRLMDGLHSRQDDAIVVLACTNNPGALDPAVRRRLPCLIEVGIPSEADRRHILKLVTRDEEAQLPASFWVVQETEGFSGSDLSHLYRTASSRRLRRLLNSDDTVIDHLETSLPPLSDDDWRLALDDVRRARRAAIRRTCTESREKAVADFLSGIRRVGADSSNQGLGNTSDDEDAPVAGDCSVNQSEELC